MKKHSQIFRLFILGTTFTLFSACCCLKLKKCPSNVIIANDGKNVTEIISEPIDREIILHGASTMNTTKLCDLKKELGLIPDNADCNAQSAQIKKCFCSEDLEKWEIPDGFDIEEAIGSVRESAGTGREGDVIRNRGLGLARIDSVVTGDFSKDDVQQNGISPNAQIVGLTNPILAGIMKPAAIKKYNGNDIVVAIVDTGIDMQSFTNHETKFLDTSDFNTSCGRSSGGTANTGWNFLQNTPNIGDEHSHGTLVAKNILENLTTHKKRFTLLPLKVFDESGKSTIWEITCAFAYLNKLQEEKGYDIAIVNASFGASITKVDYDKNKNDFLLLKKYMDTIKNKSVIVTSAGNKGRNNDTMYHFPSSFISEELYSTKRSLHIFSVAGLDKKIYSDVPQFEVFEDSNRGKGSVNISAPWEYTINLSDRMQIISDLLGGNDRGIDIALLQGTSYSAAFFSSKLLNNLLKNSVTPRGELLLNSFLIPQKDSEQIKEVVKDGKYIK